ncbi:MAG: CehA/McbA family metallohydrolase [Bacillota bacterium]
MKGMIPPERHEVSGVIHCHSTYSDGMEPVSVIAEAANQAGLDFLLMTDHDTLAPLHELGEQWVERTLLLFGVEITPRHNHYLAYGVTQSISPHLPPALYTAAVAEQGGIGFLAHPVERGSSPLGQNSYTWEDWSVTAYTGIEIWNYFSQWIGACSSRLATARTLIDWRSAVRAPYPETLARWDQLGLQRRVVGIGGMDAHGIKVSLLGRQVTLHPYLRAFRAIRTHLLLPRPFTRDLRTDRLLVMEALREGSCYVANHEEGDPTGFRFLGRRGDQWVEMGQEVAMERPGELFLSTRVPYQHRGKPVIRILKDGVPIAETRDCDLQVWDQGPGVYRVEAWRNGRGWIFSNPIYLRG